MSEAKENNMGVIEGRVFSLEAGLQRQHDDMQTLSKRMNLGFDNINSKLDNMGIARAEGSRTPWGVIISAISVIMTIMVLALTPLIYMGKMNHADNEGVATLLRDHELKIGHPAVVSKAEANSDAIMQMDINLQREMRDRDEIMGTRLHELEKNFNLQVSANKEIIIRGIKWRDEHDKRVVGLNATQTERIRALERKAFKEKKTK